MAASDIIGKLWKVTRERGFTLWMKVVSGFVVGVHPDRLVIGDSLVILDEDEYGNIRFMCRYGTFWNTYHNLKQAAKVVKNG